jgi:catechol 2,3-dioxygenase-like lactoylglutathione lyase family enzyme
VAVGIQAVHPVLTSRDVVSSLRFFERLGFHESFRDRPKDPRYAAVTRDGVEIHLQWHARDGCEHDGDRPTYRFLVTDVDNLHAEFLEAGALPDDSATRSPWSVPGDTPWGTREFHVRDPDGNGLQFYRPSGLDRSSSVDE